MEFKIYTIPLEGDGMSRSYKIDNPVTNEIPMMQAWLWGNGQWESIPADFKCDGETIWIEPFPNTDDIIQDGWKVRIIIMGEPRN